MRWSKQLIPTLREVPQEAELASHQLLLRAGLIRKLSAGLYTFLPVGLRALRKVEQIVREEMDRAGALEVLMPAVQPADLWRKTGRYETMIDVMFHIRDRQDREMVLGPTHEEVVTELAAHGINSYRQLPRNFYQIQTKFRDEIRPRFGLMRAKEFVMKDAYSFDADDVGADRSYQAMYEAYQRIFHRCGLRTQIVQADTGAMGGSSSHEFMVVAESGEDGIVDCSRCEYAANLEKAESVLTETVVFEEREEAVEEVATPNARTIEDVAAFLKVAPRRLIKTLIYVADEKVVAVLVPGDREVNELKLARVLDADELALADDATIKKVTGAPVGFAGPVGLDLPLHADQRLRGYQGAATGANKKDAHLLHVSLERDARVASYADITYARDGDACPSCGGELTEQRGVEVGHVFKLGTKYSEALGGEFLDAEGKQRLMIMGCYGIGVTRTLQAVIEQCHDRDGIQWPASVAPYAVEVLAINTRHVESVAVAESLVGALEERGIDVLYDDRKERPGVKFKDADLLGCPIRVGVGEKSLARGVVEIRLRSSGEEQEASPEEAPEKIMALLQEALDSLEQVSNFRFL